MRRNESERAIRYSTQNPLQKKFNAGKAVGGGVETASTIETADLQHSSNTQRPIILVKYQRKLQKPLIALL